MRFPQVLGCLGFSFLWEWLACYCFPFLQWSRKRMLKLVVDGEYESSSTEDSTPECQRSRPRNSSGHSTVNGNIYIAQNGSVVRTRRACLPDSLKVPSPVRMGRHLKKLDKLAVTHEEKVPLNTLSTEKVTRRPTLVTFAPCPVVADHSVVKPPGTGKSTAEQDSMVDSKIIRETVELHSDHTPSDEEEVWMGPWNSLHIPMTKLWPVFRVILIFTSVFNKLNFLLLQNTMYGIYIVHTR